MRSTRFVIFLITFVLLLPACGTDENSNGGLQLEHVFLGTSEISLSGPVSTGLPVDRPVSLIFSAAVDPSSAAQAIELITDNQTVSTQLSFSGNTIVVSPVGILGNNKTYVLRISEALRGARGESFITTEVSFKTALRDISVTSVIMKGTDVRLQNQVADAPLDLGMAINFSDAIDEASLANAIALSGKGVQGVQAVLSNENKTLTLSSTIALPDLTKYTLTISGLKGNTGEQVNTFTKTFYTTIDPTPDFPIITDNALLDKVQQQTFKYFWDFGHPASGMARERNTSGDIVTTGGSGFALMAMIVAMERSFITRNEGLERLDKILTFLETADRFHGVWPHWLNGNTGDVVPFSTKDDGGDLVETSFLVQGLIAFRQYLDAGNAGEATRINRINALWQGVEWDWYRKNNENVLYWHWSPNYGWEMNFPLYGYFEEQITYLLAASSPTHSIPKVVYTNGYGKNGAIVKNNTYYGYKLPLESPAPLFWVQYSYLGLDPHFTDDYANYWEQNVNATRINQAYCIANPKKYIGYSDACWGLTSSDNQSGYGAHSPANDVGVITPTAALSSFPYTPEESMKALKFFYYTIGDRLWGEYGFYDAFNLTSGWTADSYLAIDQGPIVVMIENYRTGLLWDLFMSAPEVQEGVTELGFTY